MIRTGDLVKIDDIGTPAVCIGVREHEVKLDLFGEQFWIINTVCQSIADDEETDDAA